MPTFHWKGRGPGGQDIQGDMTAASKRDVLESLRAKRITVTSVTDGGKDGSPAAMSGPGASFGGDEVTAQPPPPARRSTAAEARETLVEQLHRERATQRPRRGRGLLVAAGFLAAALAIGYAAPIVVFHCEHTANNTVQCTISERDFGIIPIRAQTLDGVKSFDSEYQTYTERVNATSQRQRDMARLILGDGAGHTIRPTAWDQGGIIGLPTSEVRANLERFAGETAASRISMWQGHWVPMLFAAILAALGLLMIGLTMLSLSRAGTDRVYASVEKLAAAADAREAARHHQR